MSSQAYEVIILAGTQLPLLLRGAEPEGLAFLDTTLSHVRTAIAAMLNNAGSIGSCGAHSGY